MRWAMLRQPQPTAYILLSLRVHPNTMPAAIVQRWFVVVNPHAGGGKGHRHWPRIRAELERAGLSFEFALTEFRHHALQITQDAIKQGFRHFVAVGGDGTFNEVVNGMFGQTSVPTSSFRLAVVAVGTGNDWPRMYAHPRSYQQQVQAIADGHWVWQDVGVAEYCDAGATKTRYFVNSAGCGFEADVVDCTNRLKDAGRKGALLYMLALLRTLAAHRSAHMHVLVDGQLKASCSTFSLTAGIGRYTGGGMRQAPFALPNDGLFDTTIIQRMSKLRVALNLPRLYNGTLLNHPKITGERGQQVHIESQPPVSIEADGESLGLTPITLSTKPLSLAVMVSRAFAEGQQNTFSGQ